MRLKLMHRMGSTAALAFSSAAVLIADASLALAQVEAVEPVDGGDGSNWGWIGLLGLIGLAGLWRRREPRRTTYAEPRAGEATRTTTTAHTAPDSTRQPRV